MKLRALLGFSAIALPVLGVQAQAQSFPDECAGISGVNEASNSEVNECLKPVINARQLASGQSLSRRLVACTNTAYGVSGIASPCDRGGGTIWKRGGPARS